MSVWLRWNRKCARKDLGYGKMKDVDLSKEPCPTVQAMGLGGVFHGQWFIEITPEEEALDRRRGEQPAER